MSNSIFCSDCGMIKSNCVCGKHDAKHIKIKNNSEKKKKSKSKGLFSFKKPKTIEEMIDSEDIPEVYSIEDHRLDSETILKLKNQYPNIDEDIIENFPFEKPRTGQLQIIQDINEAIQNGFKYIILEAGTGTGKSVIATTLAQMYESAYILTMTKQLQAQYTEEFDFPLVKGRGNFSCLQDNLDSTCDIGTCKTTPSSSKFFCQYGVAKNPTLGAKEAFEDSFGGPIFYQSDAHCHYWNQKANAINSPITLMNYDYAILELNYVKHFAPRSLLILDEAHNIENKLMRTMEVVLYNKRLEKDINKAISPKTIKNGEVKDWIMEIDAIYDAYKEIDTKDLSKSKVERIVSTISRLKQLRDNLEKEPKNWVIDPDESGVAFKPLRVHQYAKDYLFKYGDVCIFLSATILSHKMFSKWLGLNPNEVYHVKVDSPFPPEKRPIILDLAGKMSANRIKQTAPKTINILKEILEKHKNDKGLIHTNSYKCQNYINKHLHNSRLISHNSLNRETVLNHFEEDENPLVLVSPSMSEGVDLPYDKCRFQVIYKIPFPYLGDKQVNMRKKRDQRWYAYKTVMTLMQAYGRGMRAEDDYCYTYVLDSDINLLFKSPMFKSLIPEFFKEAIVDDS
ncbi:ATP-dependent DNA helicase [Methanobrevibacter sp. OttesenSCG-928-K11]|nr:ATP-dependent DNA helicase [Methanobrevibacter sp. OttesenSCG-928-K11]MDL2270429.1 ATP-dependent DNA helicase [Methanobrevibacter sp. OttesenSCG-928-I08]